ncbi:MAG: ChrR family anti-sigma-E factor [Rhodospirillaceae bacterium]
MTNPTHHPCREILLDYADGSLGEPAALVIATHLAFCPGCRQQVADLEAVGGVFLEEEELRPVSDDCLEAVMARLDEPAPASGPRPCTASPPPVDLHLPEPLRSYVGAPLAALHWHSRFAGFAEVDLKVGRPPVRTRLIRVVAGLALPRHSHTGTELNLVLAGGFHDPRGSFRRGDVALDDASIDHSPVVDGGEDCICLSVTDAPLRLTGGLTRFLNPFIRL